MIFQIKLCKFHTTFPYPKGSEENVKEFISVSMEEFFSLEKAGKFAYVAVRLGYHYGLSINELHSDGRICLLASGVFHAVNLLWFGLKPRLILVTTYDTILFIKRIKELYNEMRTFIREEVEEQSSSNKEEAWWKMGKSESDNLQKEGKISEYEKKIETNGSPSLNNPTKLKKSNSRIKISASVSFTTQDFVGDNPLNEERSDFSQEILNYFYGKEGSNLIEDQFVQSMLNSRDKCLDIHNNWPGLFQLAVTTDNLDAAYKKIIQELRTIYNETDTKDELNFNKSCSAYKEIVTRRTKKMMEYLLIQNK